MLYVGDYPPAFMVGTTDPKEESQMRVDYEFTAATCLKSGSRVGWLRANGRKGEISQQTDDIR